MLRANVGGSVGRADSRVRALPVVPHSLTLERAVDAVLADSFPASDPPSWTPGIAEARPGGVAAVKRPVTSSASPVWRRRLASLAGAVALALAFPLFVVGLPLALAWRAVLTATKWRAT